MKNYSELLYRIKIAYPKINLLRLNLGQALHLTDDKHLHYSRTNILVISDTYKI